MKMTVEETRKLMQKTKWILPKGKSKGKSRLNEGKWDYNLDPPEPSPFDEVDIDRVAQDVYDDIKAHPIDRTEPRGSDGKRVPVVVIKAYLWDEYYLRENDYDEDSRRPSRAQVEYDREYDQVLSAILKKYDEIQEKDEEESSVDESYTSPNPFVQDVRKYAKEHYNNDGWDEVVEAWDDKDIEEEIVNCKTPEEAIKKMESIVKLRKSHSDDIKGTAW